MAWGEGALSSAAVLVFPVSRPTPVTAAGLEGPLERPGSTSGVPNSVLQALSQLSVGRQSPSPAMLAQQQAALSNAALSNQLQVGQLPGWLAGETCLLELWVFRA